MQYIVHLKQYASAERSLKYTYPFEAATEQDAIEAALDAALDTSNGHGFFVVDHVEPAAPAQE